MRALFLRLHDMTHKESALLRLTQPSGSPENARRRFEVEPAEFRKLPRSPFVYWLRAQVLSLFKDLPAFEARGRQASIGVSTKDDFRYVRQWTEVGARRIGLSRAATLEVPWVGLSRGGSRHPYYADVDLVVNWNKDGRELKADISEYRGSRGWGYQWSAAINGHDFYFREGLTWSTRPHRVGTFVHVSPGVIFGATGPMLFTTQREHWVLCALLNSSAYLGLLHVLMPRGTGESGQTLKYEIGYVTAVPIPVLPGRDGVVLGELARRGWSLTRSLDARVETSHAFVVPALLQVDGESLAARSDAWAGRVRVVEAELDEIHAEIDERCFDLYGIDEADRGTIMEGPGGEADGGDGEGYAEPEEVDEQAELDVDVAGLVAGLVSWAVGVAFGRFDVRLATGERELPGEPEPFDPLPLCSPGMLVGEDGLPVATAPPGYPLDLPESGVLVDDPGDARDLTAAVRAVFDVVFGPSAEAVWDEALALLDPRGHDLRAWLRSGLFERHLKLYSKSRRKAPILWQLGTPSARYSVWLYAHGLTDDSLFQLQNDVLAQKVVYQERQVAALVLDAGGSPSARERREIDAQEAFVEELRVLLEEVKRVAPLWKPTLDDGVVLVMAPLWRLVPHKAWQRELKKRWGELADGKYDWAQLAMHLWPERVVPKCAEDRSLAIAHGLEGVFWFEDEDGKWQPCKEPTTDVDELIRQRTSTAAKDALEVSP